MLRSISTAQKFGGNGSTTLSSNRLNAHFLSRLSSTSTPTTNLNKCWQCGSPHSSNAGIQFQCTKCESLLDVPSDVVWNVLKYADHCYDFISLASICRIISIYLPSIASTKLILRNCNRNFEKFKAFCIQINLVKSKKDSECCVFSAVVN